MRLAPGFRSSPARGDDEDSESQTGPRFHHHLSARALSWLGLAPPDAPAVERRLLFAMLLVAVTAWIAALGFMSTVALSGDEKFYARNAATIADLVFRGRGSAGAVAEELVGRGWFMPGMSSLLVPLYAVQVDPAVEAIRTYVSAIVFLLWVWTLREISVTFGRSGAITFLVFPTLAAIWLLFAASAWADLAAGLLLAIVVARTFRMAVSMVEGDVRLRDVVILELIMGAMVYLRGNTIAAVAAAHGVLLLAAVSWPWSRLLPRVGKIAAGLALLGLLIAPWTLTASGVLGDTVLTTSSAPLSVAITFGDRRDICFGPCPGEGNVWFRAVRYSREYGEDRGISELDAQRQMAAYALRDVTFQGYAQQVRQNFRSFATRPHGFVTRFMSITTLDLSPRVTAMVEQSLRLGTLALYLPFLVALAVANAAVIVRSQRLQVLSVCVKVFTASVFVQPFLHRSHPRYWVSFAPLMAIGAILLLQWVSARRSAPAATAQHGSRTVDVGHRDVNNWVLIALQVAYVATVAVVAITLWMA